MSAAAAARTIDTSGPRPRARTRTRRRRGALLRIVLAVAVVASGLTALQTTVAPAPAAEAITGADFQPGNIISDEKFFNGAAMDTNSVQAFLNGKVSSCRSGYTCLKDFRQTTWTRPADAMCNQYSGAANETAAQIIAKVGNSCGVSQAVLLVLLQKEQSLVTDTWPNEGQYRSATGFACPDTAPCDAEYSGFYNQVYKAAWQYKRYTNPPGTSNFFNWIPVGKYSNIRYHPNAACGSSPVLVQNKATAGLYYYTPYQPNATALSNLYGGQTDGCSSYGNRNFWRLYTDWFGPTTNTVNPTGNFEAASGGSRTISVRGWTVDPESNDSLAVHLYVDGAGAAITKADRSRPDVGRATGKGDAHGFDYTFAATEGQHSVCAWAINVGKGDNTMLGCRTVTVSSYAPVGDFTTATGVDKAVSVSGWAVDPDTKSPIPVHIYIDSSGFPLVANKDSAAAVAKYPPLGRAHGFSATLPAAPGSHNVCAWGINSGSGTNTLISCKTVLVPNGSPTGELTTAVGRANQVEVSGFATDADASGPIQVHIYAGSRGTPIVANGAKGAFAATVAADKGTQDVCAWAINVGRGSNTLLGCKTVTVTDGSPYGEFTTAVGVSGGVQVSGKAVDPDSSSPIQVHVYAGSRGTPLVASGKGGGFSATISSDPGVQNVCAYAINVKAGSNTLLGCKSVAVPSGAPTGSVTEIKAVVGGVSVSGTAVDPDTKSPIQVHVYAGSMGTPLIANGAGGAFSATVAAKPGAQSVCVYAINVGPGANTLLTCQPVTVTDGSPSGTLSGAVGKAGAVEVSGTVSDPDATGPIAVHIYAGSLGTPITAKADGSYSATVAANAGTHSVCAWAINTGAGGNTLLGCRTATVPDRSPFGELTTVVAKTGAVEVSGWAIDPDSTGPIAVHIYAGGRGTPLTADRPSPDSDAQFPSSGKNHGFASTVSAPSGRQEVCAWAINVGAGTNTRIGCTTLTIR
jgi:hypothetical protein